MGSQNEIEMGKNEAAILQSIRETVRNVIPSDSKVVLFGSRARGDARTDSDWDLLVILHKDCLDNDDYDRYSYPLFELGWNIDAQIHPMIYSATEWQRRRFSPFFENIQRDGIEL